MIRVFLFGNTDKLNVAEGLVRGLFLAKGKTVVGEAAEVWLDDRRMMPGHVVWADEFGHRFDVKLETGEVDG